MSIVSHSLPLHVCLFADSFLPKIGGMEIAIHHLANALYALGCHVTVVAKYAKGALPFINDYTLRQYGNRFPGSGTLGADTLGSIVSLAAVHLSRPIDVIHCHSVSYAGSRVYWALKSRLLKLPVVMTPHGEDIQIVPDLNYGLRLDKKWDVRIRRNLNAAHKVTAISDTVKKQLSFIPRSKVHRIPNGIHLSEFVTEQNQLLHQRLSLSAHAKIVLSVGRHRAVKGYEYGIRAFAELAKDPMADQLHHVIVGKHSRELLPLVTSLRLQDRVFLLPQMDHEALVSAYRSAWCFLSPSLSEGLSLVSIEAMACGLPLVVTDVPGNADIVNENGCGVTVRPKDPKSIARGLTSLLTQPSLHRKLKKKAITGAARYDWSTIAKQYRQVYRQAIEQDRWTATRKQFSFS